MRNIDLKTQQKHTKPPKHEICNFIGVVPLDRRQKQTNEVVLALSEPGPLQNSQISRLPSPVS